ncbi:HNH endonuclease signature motif containing protein [Hamadaea sp. NPDC050747]|uniref:HNH endonuclease n=1 Tax=Hamadaea sp. NPDC050747 TaxID=3155789 RepID=UPI003411E730
MTTRHTTTRNRHRAKLARGKPPCGICGGAIDYSLPYMDPGEYVVDHIIPLSRGGEDTIENKQPAHRRCNRTKSDRVEDVSIIRRSGSLRR